MARQKLVNYSIKKDNMDGSFDIKPSAKKVEEKKPNNPRGTVDIKALRFKIKKKMKEFKEPI